MKKKLFILIGAAVIALAIGFSSRDNKSPLVLDSFAQCLKDRGITMYGADWCSHCQNEKKAFGKAFRFVSYVECPDNPQQCLAANISAFPTWIFSDGRKFVGEQGIEKLSKESGCPLPITYN